MPDIDAVKILQQRFRESEDSTWFISLDGNELSYRQFWASGKKLAEEWQNAGVCKNDVVAFVLPNGYSVFCCYLACAIGGFVACPVVNTLHESTVKQLLDTVNPRMVIRNSPEVIVDGDVNEYEMEVDQDAPFLIMFTSGATGVPKAICHCLHSVVSSAYSFGNLTAMTKETRLYHILPMTYMAGFLNTMLSPLLHGATIIEGPLFSPAIMLDFWSRPLQYGVNTISIIPSIASALCHMTRSQAVVKQVKQQIKQIQCTSAPIHMDLRHRFKDKFSIPLQDCYGITELGGPLTFQSYEDAVKFAESSVPLSELEIELRNDSELWIKSPFRMLGYLDKGEVSKPFDERGFMNTGDLAEYENGQIKITGRIKDIIIRGGVNISPSHLESIISLKQGIDDVSVVGHKHDFWGEEIVACVISEDNSEQMHDDILNYCKDNLGSHECPDKVLFFEKFPRSFIGKLQKKTLQEQVAVTLSGGEI